VSVYEDKPIGRYLHVPTLAFLLFCIYIPVTNNVLRGVLTALFVVFATVQFFLGKHRRWLHPTVRILFLLFPIAGLLFCLIGITQDAPGAYFSSLIFVLSPVVFIWFAASLSTSVGIRDIDTTLVAGGLAVGISGISFKLSQIGVLPFPLYFQWEDSWDLASQTLEQYSGYSRMRFIPISSLIYLVPFFTHELYRGASTSNVRRFSLWIAFILGISITLISGRRALVSCVVLGTIFSIVLGRFARTTSPVVSKRSWAPEIRIVAFAAIAILSSLALEITFEGISQEWVSAFDSETDAGADARIQQTKALLHGWLDSPVWGHGLGSYTPTVIQSQERPWAYEVQYALLLFQTGLLGFGIYSLGALWLLWKGFVIVRTNAELGQKVAPHLVAFACILFANNTNPYLETFGQLWMFFVPVAVINWALLKSSPERVSHPHFRVKHSQWRPMPIVKEE